MTSALLCYGVGSSVGMLFTTEFCFVRNLGTVAMIALCLYMADKKPIMSAHVAVATRALFWLVWSVCPCTATWKSNHLMHV